MSKVLLWTGSRQSWRKPGAHRSNHHWRSKSTSAASSSRGRRGGSRSWTQNERWSALFSEAQERFARLIDTQSRGQVSPQRTEQRVEPGSQVASLQQMVERGALEQELQQARCATEGEEDIRPVARKQTVARSATSHRDARGAIRVMPKHVLHHVMTWLRDRQAE